jgi:hypothetical protein
MDFLLESKRSGGSFEETCALVEYNKIRHWLSGLVKGWGFNYAEEFMELKVH